MELTALIDRAAALGCRVTPGAPMAGATTFRIGGPAQVLIDLPDAAAAKAVLIACRQAGIPWFVLGNGSDLLVGDRGIPGAVLRLSRSAQPQLLPEGRILCGAGVSLQRLCLFAREHALTGLEFAYGIPGTVGGALYMNAGAYGGEMADVVLEADCLLPGGQPEDVQSVTLDRAALALGYRHSALMTLAADRGVLATAVRLQLQPGDSAAIAARMKELLARRQEKQPLEYPSAGSFFKRPAGHYAGALIEEAGMKGYRVGDAQVSEKHAGFVVNRGHATAAEVRALCRDVQAAVRARAGVELEPEVRFIGDF